MLTLDNKIDFFVVLKAIELTSKGFDISSTTYTDLKSTWWNAKTKEFQSRMTDNVPEAYFELADDARSCVPWVYQKFIKRNKDKLYETLTELPEECEKTVIDLNMIRNTMTFLKKHHVYSFYGINRSEYDADYLQELSKLDVNYDKHATPTAFVEALSRDAVRKNFNTLIAMAYNKHSKSTELMSELSRIYEENSPDFGNLSEDLRDYSIVDNRMYIPFKPSWIQLLKDKNIDCTGLEDSYFVLSKNPYDYFYCSYGSEFQSCFALNSPHGGWVGAVVNCLLPSYFMLYLTKKDAQKVSMTGEGVKYPAPYMYARAWCWLSKYKRLMVDKIYAGSRCHYEDIFKDTIANVGGIMFKNNHSTELFMPQCCSDIINAYKCYYYPDSIKNYGDSDGGSMRFQYDNGYKSFYGSYKVPDFKNSLSNLVSVSDTLSLNSRIVFRNNKLYNPKTCPITGLEIDNAQDTSEYASKFKNKLTGGLAVLTYIDGFVKLDAVSCKQSSDHSHYYNFSSDEVGCIGVSSLRGYLSKDFYRISDTLDRFKDALKSDLNSDDKMEFVLLRIINGGQITWVKLRKDK